MTVGPSNHSHEVELKTLGYQTAKLTFNQRLTWVHLGRSDNKGNHAKLLSSFLGIDMYVLRDSTFDTLSKLTSLESVSGWKHTSYPIRTLIGVIHLPRATALNSYFPMDDNWLCI